MKKFVFPTLFAIGSVLVYLLMSRWNGGTWGNHELTGKYFAMGYPPGLRYMPWAVEFRFAAAFLVIGGLVDAIRSGRRWVEATRIWLIVGMFFCFLTGIAIAASPKLRVTATVHEAGFDGTLRVPRERALGFFMGALGLGALAVGATRYRRLQNPAMLTAAEDTVNVEA